MRGRRLVAALAGIVVLPLSLSACGLIGGDDQAKAPVVIPSEAPPESVAGDSSDPDASPSTPTDPASGVASDAAGLPPATATVNNTVTKTGIVVQNRTRTQTRTATATRTLPRVTATAPPITLTETRTETRTETKNVTLPANPATVTVTKTCPAAPAVCP